MSNRIYFVLWLINRLLFETGRVKNISIATSPALLLRIGQTSSWMFYFGNSHCMKISKLEHGKGCSVTREVILQKTIQALQMLPEDKAQAFVRINSQTRIKIKLVIK